MAAKRRRLTSAAESAPAASAAQGDVRPRRGGVGSPAVADVELRRAHSVVEVISVCAVPQYAYPYAQPLQSYTHSSAFVLDYGESLGKVLLCTQHAVQHATCVQVKRRDQARRHDAEVMVAGFECDLALLKVKDKSFWVGLEALELCMDLPPLLTPVTVLGFAEGGETLCTTQGVVSRLDVMSYTGRYVQLPVIQIDAAINCGSSGGPALSSGRAVGIAFSGLEASHAQNVGYLVPSRVIARFIKDFILRGEYTQFCFPPFGWQTLDTPDVQRYYGVDKQHRGVRVSIVHSSSAGKVKRDDVLLAIDGQDVGHDGKVPVPGYDTRVSLWVLFFEKLTQEWCSLRLRRGKRELAVKLKLQPYRPIIAEDPYCVGSRDYFTVAGMIFQPVSVMYMSAGEKYSIRRLRESLNRMKDYSWSKSEASDGSNRFVVLGDVLQHPVNIGVEYYKIVTAFNGKPVRGIRRLAAAVDACKAEWMKFEFGNGTVCVMSTKQARAATKDIVKKFGLSSDRYFET